MVIKILNEEKPMVPDEDFAPKKTLPSRPMKISDDKFITVSPDGGLKLSSRGQKRALLIDPVEAKKLAQIIIRLGI